MINSGCIFVLRCISSNVRPQFVNKTVRCISTTITKYSPPPELNKSKKNDFSPKNFGLNAVLQRFKGSISGNIMQESINTLQVKKRPIKKRKQEAEAGYFGVTAYATADEYDLERLAKSLREQDLYAHQKFFPEDSNDEEPKDVLHVRAKIQVEAEPRDIYFFREGTVVMWNCTDLECGNILTYLKQFEIDFYDENVVHEECEMMMYNYTKTDGNAFLRNNKFYLSKSGSPNNNLERYTYSNAISLSVKLGIWEASLDQYINSMEFVTEDLKKGERIKISRQDMLRKTGELFALRHLINLSSDLLDTPDFYWDRDQLETLYQQTCNYFSISRRTRVMNEKLNHCVELAELINSNLNDIHHVRLEWMIIILIMVEVGFEILHFADRFL
ncbi:required for meiotic nuclear division protein 1 homolog [Culicoides brevitarsis]|uniref:required for meiotic nuclear division protein 1 homolog n=1 Tax=Culicoides brevitarsis TaxID=469753 RepID=UPI00307B3DC0